MEIKLQSKIILYLILTIVAVVTIVPFYWCFTSSFKPRNQIFDEPSLINSEMTSKHYNELLTTTDFPRWVFNSMFIASCYTLLFLFFCSLGGFAFAKYSFKGKEALFLIVLSQLTIPLWAIVVPLFLWFSRLGLIDSYLSVILPGSANAFGIFLMRQYMIAVPDEIMDCARIDGCREFGIYWRIILPIVRPALGALAIFAFLQSWNNFPMPLLFLRSSEKVTIPVGLSQFVGVRVFEFGMLMAGAMLSIIPVLILFLVMQKQMVAGLTMGAVKE